MRDGSVKVVLLQHSSLRAKRSRVVGYRAVARFRAGQCNEMGVVVNDLVHDLHCSGANEKPGAGKAGSRAKAAFTGAAAGGFDPPGANQYHFSPN
jgi:hypothetical protein